MRHDLLPPTASHAALLPCAPLSLSPHGGTDSGAWLFVCPSPVPAAATPTDALEVDVHVRTQCDLLADPPLDWKLASVPPKTEALRQPESPCSVAFTGVGLLRPHPLLPAQFICRSHCDVCLDVLCGDLALADESGGVHRLLEMTSTGFGEYASGADIVKRELPVYFSAPLPTERLAREEEDPWSAVFPFECGDNTVSDASGKERLRKRQRAYERKYRKKKRVRSVLASAWLKLTHHVLLD